MITLLRQVNLVKNVLKAEKAKCFRKEMLFTKIMTIKVVLTVTLLRIINTQTFKVLF